MTLVAAMELIDLERASATMLSAPDTCHMLDVYCDTAAVWRCCLGEASFDGLKMAETSGLWSVDTVTEQPSTLALKCLRVRCTARSSRSKTG